MAKVILIDIDNTLLDFSKGAHEALAKACAHYGLVLPKDADKTFHEVNDSFWTRVEKAEINREYIYKHRFEQILPRLGFPVSTDSYTPASFDDAFRTYLNDIAIPVDGALELVKYLSSRYVLGVASNAAHDQQIKRLRMAGLLQYFTFVFISDHVGASKPNHDFWDTAMQNIRLNEKNCKFRNPEVCSPSLDICLSSVEPSDVVVLGDSYPADMSGAIEFGFETCWFNIKNQPLEVLHGVLKPDHIVSSLFDIIRQSMY